MLTCSPSDAASFLISSNRAASVGEVVPSREREVLRPST